jgi:hypothetical protein
MQLLNTNRISYAEMQLGRKNVRKMSDEFNERKYRCSLSIAKYSTLLSCFIESKQKYPNGIAAQQANNQRFQVVKKL